MVLDGVNYFFLSVTLKKIVFCYTSYLETILNDFSYTLRVLE